MINEEISKKKPDKIVVILSIILVLIVIVGALFLVTFHKVESNPSNYISEKWDKGLTRYLFLWRIRKGDKDLARLVKTYIINYEKNKEYLEELDTYRLRLLRNFLFAVHGYDFGDIELRNYFQKFTWYHPDINTSPSIDELSDYEAKIVEAILSYESIAGNLNYKRFNGLGLLRNMLPKKVTDYVFWDFAQLDPKGDLPNLLSVTGNISIIEFTDHIFHIIRQMGIDPESIISVTLFRLEKDYSDTIVPFDIIIEADGIDTQKIPNLIKEHPDYANVEDSGGFKTKVIHKRFTIAITDFAFIFVNDEATLESIMATYKGEKAPLEIVTKKNDKDIIPALLMKFNYGGINTFSIGPKILGVKNIKASLFRNSNDYEASFSGSLFTIDESKSNSLNNQSGFINPSFFNGTVLMTIDLWPALLINSSTSTQLKYSIIDNSFEIILRWDTDKE